MIEASRRCTQSRIWNKIQFTTEECAKVRAAQDRTRVEFSARANLLDGQLVEVTERGVVLALLKPIMIVE
jgi:hypothetical protein